MASAHDEPYPVIDATAWPLHLVETVGDSQEVWLRDPQGTPWLFKPRKPYAHAGDDWAERVTTQIARLLQVPAATAELSQRGQQRGTISRDVRPQAWELQHGALLLAERDAGFEVQQRTRAGHDLDRIHAVLEGVLAPPGRYGDGFDAFAGYLVLDALVANVDRHEANWAVLRPPPSHGPMRLSPSWDHGSALGHNLTDRGRQELLGRDAVEEWARRGRASRFDSRTDGRLDLVGLADRALSMSTASAADAVRDRLATLDESALTLALTRAPGLSVVARTFTTALLHTNLRRLRDDCC